MNYWTTLPNRDEVLDKIYQFLQLLAENQPDEAEKLVRVGSMDAFRDNLRHHLKDYTFMYFDDEEMNALPEDLSLAVVDPFLMDENDIMPTFSGNNFIVTNKETIEVKLGFNDNITNIRLQFMIYKIEEKFFLNLMKINKE